jgi:hypothetical protein
MKQSTSTNRILPQATDSAVNALSRSPIVSVYLDSLPPRSAYPHSCSVEFFFSNEELAISGDIVQVGPKEEAFYVAFHRTLGLKYWKEKLDKPQIVSKVCDLAAAWRNAGLQALLAGPRDVRLFKRNVSEKTKAKLAGVEIAATLSPHQRVLFVASEDDPGDVIVVTPSDEYASWIARLAPL